MIDLEQILVIGIGLLVLALYFSALALTIDWQRAAERWGRAAKYWRVLWKQADERDRDVMVWTMRAAWVWVLIVVGVVL
jgi:hypothetical protein